MYGDYSYQIYQYLQNNIYPVLTSIRSVLDTVSHYAFYGLIIGFMAFGWFFLSKFVQSILYK